MGSIPFVSFKLFGPFGKKSLGCREIYFTLELLMGALCAKEDVHHHGHIEKEHKLLRSWEPEVGMEVK